MGHISHEAVNELKSIMNKIHLVHSFGFDTGCYLLLSLGSRVLFEKLIVNQPVKKLITL
jgi:hypothetical protein